MHFQVPVPPFSLLYIPHDADYLRFPVKSNIVSTGSYLTLLCSLSSAFPFQARLSPPPPPPVPPQTWILSAVRKGYALRSVLKMTGRGFGVAVVVGYLVLALTWLATAATTRILLDTDMDTDDIFALLYLLKQNRSVIDVKAVTINTNSWTDAGHAVNHLYDLLYMMNRDDIAVGVGGEGGISSTGTISPNVGGYHPLIEQGTSTVGYCRYRQAIPPGRGGRLDVDTNYGIRRGFLPQGSRKYSPLQQATAQEVMIKTISTGPTTVLLIGAHTNLAILLMTHPELKKNIQHIFVMGGGVRSKNPTGCCLDNSSPCIPIQCGDVGNLFSAYTANPYAEFNMFCDPFSAYQVFHSGIPITLVPLDATNTIPITKEFFQVFGNNQSTYESQYCFQSLQMIRDTWFDNQFYAGYFMWDSFMSGVAVSIIENGYKRDGYNDFAIMTYMNITVITSNEPYGIHDGSNPFFDGHNVPMFNLIPRGIHSGHVQMGIQDPFCYVSNGTEIGKCQDGHTKEVTGIEAVQVLVAQYAKPNQDARSILNREFFQNFLEALNRPQQSARYNIANQFPFNKEALQKPNLINKNLGKVVIFDMDMSAGDFLSLIYLLKVPVEKINLKGILVNGNGWANSATIDIVYDILHMMGRDDIPVGLGSVSAIGTSSMDCKYVRYIPHGSGGYIDSDTLFGLGRNLPRSPRRYSADNSVAFGAPRNTNHPELRQPLAMEVWKSITSPTSSQGIQKVTILSNGPLTNLANIILSDNSASKAIQDIYIVGGHISETKGDLGNIFTVPSNQYSEFNFFLDPLAAKIILQSKLHITLIPLSVQRTVSSLPTLLKQFQASKATPEAAFTYSLLSTLNNLYQKSPLYNHVDIFLGEILGATILVNDPSLHVKTKDQRISIVADANDVTNYGQVFIDNKGGRMITIIDSLDTNAYYNHFTSLLNVKEQSTVKTSSGDHKINWTSNMTG